MSFNFELLQQSRWKNMAKVFSMLPGDKILLVDPQLLQPLDRVASMSMLRKLKVVKVFQTDTLPPKKEYKKLAYLVPPTSTSIDLIAKHCEVDTANEIRRTRLVIFVPQDTQDVRYLLESRGLSGHHVCVTGLSLGWINLDADLISLNLPILYTDYFLYGDYTWPHFMGTELGELLQLACGSDLAPMGCRVHAFGEAANVVASGVRLHCIRSGLVKHVNPTRLEVTPRMGKLSDQLPRWGSQSSMSSSSQDASSTDATLRPPPLVIIFSRDLDYVTPMLLPMTFEALIHEILGIELGIVSLSDPSSNEPGPRKQFLNASKMHYYKDARDVHIAHIYTLLSQWRTNLQEQKADLETELAGRSMASSRGEGTSLHELKVLSAQVGPLLAQRRELTTLLLALEQIMDVLTRRERIEDVRAAQTLLLRSGSGGSLAATQSQMTTASDELGSPGTSSNTTSEGKRAAATTASGGNCGTVADELSSMPLRLAVEWMSTHRGDRLIQGIRMAALASVTHDGVADETYTVLHRAVLHAAGQAAYPMLLALRELRLFAPRSVYLTAGVQPDPRSPPLLENGTGLSTTTSAGTHKTQSTSKSAGVSLSAAVARLGLSTKRKSLYNRLHHLLRLSHSGQTNRRVDQPPVSPTYVYSGQHCPIVVRLAESVWSISLASSLSGSSTDHLGDTNKSGSRSTDPELIAKPQLIAALKLLGLSDQAATKLGLVSFADPSLAAAGYQTEAFNHARRLNAPLAKPLPCSATEQPVVVVFPGGCTYGEVAALRFVAARRHWHLLIATSSLLTSHDLLQQAGQSTCQTASTDSAV